MLEILLPMASLIAVGTLWRPLQPMGLDADTTRRALTGLVYLLLLPALVIDVIWQATIGLDSFRIILMALTGIMVSIAMATVIYRQPWLPLPARGALILAASWANVTYLGLPVLEQTFGNDFRSVAIHYDLFANTPLLLTVGVWIARHHGSGMEPRGAVAEIVRVPALWAAVLALLLNLNHIPQPQPLSNLLQMLGGAVSPLMLLALGMGLRWDLLRWHHIPLLLPAVLIQLLLTPLVIYWSSWGVGLEGELRAAVVLEAAMPTMILGIVICDRYQLDTALFAATTTLSTVLSLVTLPIWYQWL